MVTKVGDGNCKPSLPEVKKAQRSSLPENRLPHRMWVALGRRLLDWLAPFCACRALTSQSCATIPTTAAINTSPRQNHEAA